MSHVGKTKDEVPLVPWIEVLIGNSKDAERFKCLILFQCIIDLSGIILNDSLVDSVRDLVMSEEVSWDLLGPRLTISCLTHDEL